MSDSIKYESKIKFRGYMNYVRYYTSDGVPSYMTHSIGVKLYVVAVYSHGKNTRIYT